MWEPQRKKETMGMEKHKRSRARRKTETEMINLNVVVANGEEGRKRLHRGKAHDDNGFHMKQAKRLGDGGAGGQQRRHCHCEPSNANEIGTLKARDQGFCDGTWGWLRMVKVLSTTRQNRHDSDQAVHGGA
ncbi:trinucleotide repeat-containing protein-like isoform [Sesbania bispinosa]|nr:trinucleotide repeat-containing protein-like isoform [Sesbania bispinosa]